MARTNYTGGQSLGNMIRKKTMLLFDIIANENACYKCNELELSLVRRRFGGTYSI